MKKICIITIYLGNLPKYFNLWLQSCQFNSSIDFCIVTDQEVKNLPSNVQSIKMNLLQIKKLAENKLGEEVCLKTPYKLCDYKPMYGLFFEDYLKEYDFWGHCDIDLIFGDIRKFVTEEILNKYNKIYHLGHLSLYKNDEFTKHAFKLDGSLRGDYKLAISTDKITIFDEIYGILEIFKKQGIPVYSTFDFADIDFTRERVTAYPIKNYPTQLFCYNNGKCLRYFAVGNEIREEEFVYIHMQKRIFVNTVTDCKMFAIAPHRFISISRDEITVSRILEINPYMSKFLEELESFCKGWRYRIIRKLKGTTL